MLRLGRGHRSPRKNHTGSGEPAFIAIADVASSSGRTSYRNRKAATAPGSAQGLYLIVSDIEAARDELLGRGVEISEVFHDAGGVYAGTDEPYLFGRLRVSGLDPEHRSYRSYASFSDPDGNGWLFQEVTVRLPGRVDAEVTTFTSSTELATALRRAAAAHGEHEKRAGQHDADWPDWYAEYIVREQAGKELPS
jgi:hypothetical protein